MDIDVDQWSEDERMDEDSGAVWAEGDQIELDGDEAMSDGDNADGVYELEIDMEAPTPKAEALGTGTATLPGAMELETVSFAPTFTSPLPSEANPDPSHHTPELEMRAAPPSSANANASIVAPPSPHAAEPVVASASPMPIMEPPIVAPSDITSEETVAALAEDSKGDEIEGAIRDVSPDHEEETLTTEAVNIEKPVDEDHSKALDDTPAPKSPFQAKSPEKAQEPSLLAANVSDSMFEEESFEEGGEVIEDEDEQDFYEDDSITAETLPSLILHLPHNASSPLVHPARAIFAPVESDPDQLPVWLENRQLDLAEASLAHLWAAIRAECASEGLIPSAGDGMIISEKLMDLKMSEDDVNIQSITFIEFIQLYHGCDLPEPVQLYLSWEPSRFITRFNAIQSELDSVRSRNASPEIVEENDVVDVADPDGVQVESHGGEFVDDGPFDDQENAKNQEQHQDLKPDDKQTENRQEINGDDQNAEKHQNIDSKSNTDDIQRLESDHPNWADAAAAPAEALQSKGTESQISLRDSQDPEPAVTSDVIVPAPAPASTSKQEEESGDAENGEAGADAVDYEVYDDEEPEDGEGEEYGGEDDAAEEIDSAQSTNVGEDRRDDSHLVAGVPVDSDAVGLIPGDSIVAATDTVHNDESALKSGHVDFPLKEEVTTSASSPPTSKSAEIVLASGLATPVLLDAEVAALTPDKMDQAKAVAEDTLAHESTAIAKEVEPVDELKATVNAEVEEAREPEVLGDVAGIGEEIVPVAADLLESGDAGDSEIGVIQEPAVVESSEHSETVIASYEAEAVDGVSEEYEEYEEYEEEYEEGDEYEEGEEYEEEAEAGAEDEGYGSYQETLDDDEENRAQKVDSTEVTITETKSSVENDGATLPKRSHSGDEEEEEGESKKTRRV